MPPGCKWDKAIHKLSTNVYFASSNLFFFLARHLYENQEKLGLKYHHSLKKDWPVNKLLLEGNIPVCCHDLEVLFISYTKPHCKTLISPLQETYLLDGWYWIALNLSLKCALSRLCSNSLSFSLRSKSQILSCVYKARTKSICTARWSEQWSTSPYRVQSPRCGLLICLPVESHSTVNTSGSLVWTTVWPSCRH